jgi:probable HAF family extracellular repeat protein
MARLRNGLARLTVRTLPEFPLRVKVPVRHRIQQLRRTSVAHRALVLSLATLAVVGACGEQDVAPTAASVGGRVKATPTVVSATVTVLPTLGGTSTFAADINDAGEVVGWSFTADGQQRAFLWTAAGGMRDLGTLGGGSSSASAINEAGQIVGTSGSTDAKNARHAFLWTPGSGMRDLGTLSAQFSVATGINDNGLVVGNNVVLNFRNRAFLWTSDLGMRDLDANSGGWAPASAINNVGQVVGYFLQSNGPASAFLWSADYGLQDLGRLDGVSTAALAINDAGQVVGSTWIGEQPPRAFLWLPGEGMRELGTLGGVGTEAFGINDAGQVVGYGTTTDGAARHAFVWTARDGMEDLYPLTGMTDARAINNRGQVVGGDRVAALRFQTPNGASEAVKGSGFYVAAGQAKSKAHFTFNVTFLPGSQTAPNGAARFWIPGSRVDFESGVIEMLVVSNNRAQFWGTGTLNGAPARFRITAVDGRQPGGGRAIADAFRIELWDAGGTLVYDTQPGAAPGAALATAIDGGRIQIGHQ